MAQITTPAFGTMTAQTECPSAASTASGVTDPKEVDVSERTCSVDGCERPTRYQTSDLCAAHYQRVRRNGEPGSPSFEVQPHSVTPERYTVDPESGCWVWTWRLDVNGYGRIGCEWAHRFSYAQHKGAIPEGYEIDHTCQNPPCVNPEHLDAVTKAEHCARTMRRLGKDDKHQRAAFLRQMGLTYVEIAEVMGLLNRTSAHQAVISAIAKGLVKADDIPPGHFLTPGEREDIRALHAMGVPQSELVRWYGVDSSNISRTISGRRGRRS